MDVLVSLGTNASYMFSVISLLFERAHQVRVPHHVHSSKSAAKCSREVRQCSHCETLSG